MGLQPETEIGICEQLTQQMTDAEKKVRAGKMKMLQPAHGH